MEHDRLKTKTILHQSTDVGKDKKKCLLWECVSETGAGGTVRIDERIEAAKYRENNP